MAFMDIFGSAKNEGDEFDEKEPNDLALHVRQCGRRYRALDRKMNVLIRLTVFGFLIMYASNIPSVVKGIMTLLTTP